MKARAYCDGSGGSPRGSTAACVVVSEQGEIIAEESSVLEICSNNVAEYEGLLLAMKTASKLGIKDLMVYSDSQLIVNQVTGNWDIKKTYLLGLRDQAWDLGEVFDSLELLWIPREENKRADHLCRVALDTHHPPKGKRKKRSGRSKETKKWMGLESSKRNVFIPPEVQGERDPASFV